MSSYIIGTGFYSPPEQKLERQEFLEIWIKNTSKYSEPKKVVLVTSDSFIAYYYNDMYNSYANVEIINLPHNPGHSLQKNNSIMCGWQSSFIISAMIAYSSNCDFIYKEQDCLCFGPWVEQLYKESEKLHSPILMGKFKSDQTMENEISLIFVKRDFIPKLVQTLIMVLDENLYTNPYPERIMGEVAQICGIDNYHFSFGYGRDRPVNFDDEVFYIQHIGYHKYQNAIDTWQELKERKLI